jgi:tetratricopeptide repeat protein 8
MAGNRTALRSAGRPGTAKNVRLGSASMFAYGDPTGPLFHASRLNPEKFAKKETIAKSLFQYLYYHDGDLNMSLLLCESVIRANGNSTAWWWHTQKARCCIAMGNPRAAEVSLKASLAQLQHPDTVLLLARVYIKLDQPLQALDVCHTGLEKLPEEISLLTQQARIHELIGSVLASVRIYRQIGQLEAMNAEALACIAVHHFYSNQPETALLYYRRILSMGAHSAEIYCNIGLCCLYGGQLDLVLPCFQRALRLATTQEQKADVWYNLSFVAIVSLKRNSTKKNNF